MENFDQETAVADLRGQKVAIINVAKNLPELKCLELQTDQGEQGYLECNFDPISQFTTTTIYYKGAIQGSSRSPSLGNETATVMTAAFNVLPSLVARPEFD